MFANTPAHFEEEAPMRPSLQWIKNKIVSYMLSGHMDHAQRGLAELKSALSDPEEISLLNTASLFACQGQTQKAIALLEDKAKLGPALLMRRAIAGRDIGTLDVLPMIPLDLIQQALQPPKPSCARKLSFTN